MKEHRPIAAAQPDFAFPLRISCPGQSGCSEPLGSGFPEHGLGAANEWDYGAVMNSGQGRQQGTTELVGWKGVEVAQGLHPSSE